MKEQTIILRTATTFPKVLQFALRYFTEALLANEDECTVHTYSNNHNPVVEYSKTNKRKAIENKHYKNKSVFQITKEQ